MPQKSGYFPLPQELQEEIFRNLDVETFLSLRSTCREFHTATTSLWLYFARQIQSRPQNTRSEEPLEDYTPEELRHWALRRHQVEQIWNKPSSPGLQKRSSSCALSGPIVIPGGRWLLSFSKNDEMIAVDMDSPEMKPRVLFQINRRFKEQMNWLRVWVDPREPRLTFKIAAINRDYLGGASPPYGSTGVYIFHGRLLGHGKDAILTAEPLRRFEGIFPGDTEIGALNDRCLILLKASDSDGGQWEFKLHIFDYERDCVVTVRLPGLEVTSLLNLFFLPSDKIAIVHPESVYIYAFPTFPEVSGSEWYPLRTITLDRVLEFAQPSEPYIGETSTTIIFNRNGIAALIIPHDPNESHTFVPITEFSGHFAVLRTTGLFDAVDYSNTPGNLKLLMYSWDPLSEDGVRGVKVRRHEVDVSDKSGSRCLSFHAAIGRLVIHRLLDQPELIVYDMIPAKAL